MTDAAMPHGALDRMRAVKPCAEILGPFLEWLQEQGYVICEWSESGGYGVPAWAPIRQNIEQLLADYFGIDLEQVEAEKRAVLAAWRQEERDE
jgi:hypothetical protein